MPTEVIHIFRQGATTFGYTLDRTGASLPQMTVGGHWVFSHSIHPKSGDGPAAGPQIADVRAGVERDGYYVSKGSVSVALLDQEGKEEFRIG